MQKQKKIEEEFNQNLAELRAELGFVNDLKHKLERKMKTRDYELIQVTSLENENNLLENKQKELEGTIQGLLESKEDFVKAYEDSTYEMKRAIADKDRKNDVLAEKLKAHLSLFGSISKEVPSINKFMDDARQALRRKEDGLRSEVGNLGIVMKKIQDAVSGIQIETAILRVSPAVACSPVGTPDIVQFTSKDSHLKSSMIEESTGSNHALALCCKKHNVTRMQKFTDALQFFKAASPSVQEDSIKSPLKKDDKINCYVSESVCAPSPSASSVPQCDADNASAFAATAKVNFENKLLSRLPVDGSFQVTIFMWILTIVLRAIAQELGLLSAPPMDSDCGFPCHKNECS
ncbi:putative DNA binding protein [Capsicum annuum]|nr:putative DNA binding protein [Capsicum annuum]